jgi:hypothetical protein
VPFTVEWNAIGLLLFVSALVSPRMLPLAVIPLAISLAWSIGTAWRARIDPRFSGAGARALVAALTYLGPLARGLQRYLWRLRGFAEVEPVDFEGPRRAARIDWSERAFTAGFWSEQGHEKEALLGAVMEFLIPRKYLITIDPGWNRWDLEVYRGIWSKARLTVAAENHGGMKRLLNVRCEVRLTRVSQLAAAGYFAAVGGGLLFGVPEVTGVGLALGGVNLTLVVLENLRLGGILRGTLDVCARRIGLKPLDSAAMAPQG